MPREMGSTLAALKCKLGYDPRLLMAAPPKSLWVGPDARRGRAEAIAQIGEIGGGVEQDQRTQMLTINNEVTVALCIARCNETAAGSLRWQIRFDTGLSPDVIVALRMDRENQIVQDYYILPRIDLPGPQVRLGEHNGLALDSFRFDTLDQLYEMAARTKLGDLR